MYYAGSLVVKTKGNVYILNHTLQAFRGSKITCISLIDLMDTNIYGYNFIDGVTNI